MIPAGPAPMTQTSKLPLEGAAVGGAGVGDHAGSPPGRCTLACRRGGVKAAAPAGRVSAGPWPHVRRCRRASSAGRRGRRRDRRGPRTTPGSTTGRSSASRKARASRGEAGSGHVGVSPAARARRGEVAQLERRAGDARHRVADEEEDVARHRRGRRCCRHRGCTATPSGVTSASGGRCGSGCRRGRGRRGIAARSGGRDTCWCSGPAGSPAGRRCGPNRRWGPGPTSRGQVTAQARRGRRRRRSGARRRRAPASLPGNQQARTAAAAVEDLGHDDRAAGEEQDDDGAAGGEDGARRARPAGRGGRCGRGWRPRRSSTPPRRWQRMTWSARARGGDGLVDAVGRVALDRDARDVLDARRRGGRRGGRRGR